MSAELEKLVRSIVSVMPAYSAGQFGGHSTATTEGAIYRTTNLLQSTQGTLHAVANGGTYAINSVVAAAELKLPSGTTSPSVCMCSDRTLRLIPPSKTGLNFTTLWDPTTSTSIVQRAGIGIPNGSGAPAYFVGYRRSGGGWYQEIRDPVLPGGELLIPIDAALAAAGVDPTAGFTVGTSTGEGVISTNAITTIQGRTVLLGGVAPVAYAPNYMQFRYMFQMQATGLLVANFSMFVKGFAQMSWSGSGYVEPSKPGEVTRTQNSATLSDFVAFAPKTSGGNQIGFRPSVFIHQSSAPIFMRAYLVPFSAVAGGSWSDVPGAPVQINSTCTGSSLATATLTGLTRTATNAGEMVWTTDFGATGDQEVALVPSGFADTQQALLIQVGNVSGNSATSTTLGWQLLFTTAS